MGRDISGGVGEYFRGNVTLGGFERITKRHSF